MSSASRRLLTLGLLSSFVWVGTASAQTDAPPPPPPPAPVPEAQAPPPPPPPPPGKDAKYEFGKVEEVKTVVWKASASAGFSAATGNAEVLNFSGGGLVSRNDGKNKVQVTVEGLYSNTKQPNGFIDTNNNKVLDADESINDPLLTETAANLKGLARYDRFFTTNNTVFATFFAGFDNPASKQYFLGGQLGYARQIVKTKMHEMFGEVGGDFTYDYLRAPDPSPMGFSPEVILGSGRLFLGYVLSVNTHTSVRANVETLINLNALTIGDRSVGAAEATRVNGKLEFTTQIWKPISFRAAFTARFNNAPAPSTRYPSVKEHPEHYNRKLDTLTELGLVVNFI
ncbi:MAG: DUF481 domain-containing protein [Myxococcales bacterium]|nr:DUF481 domain-containing protein [Myxococcales bacterium]